MRRFLSLILTLSLAVQQTLPAFAQTLTDRSQIELPAPGVMVHTSGAYAPVMVKGLRVYPENPLQFDFIVDTGSGRPTDDELKPRAATLIKYFLTALTVPDDELWVNLSPYEQDRIIPDNFAVTDMGRDLLSQDYLLKQLTASLMYPEDGVGQQFWGRVYQKSQQLFGTTDISVDTFNKVWVVPEKAKIYLSGDVAFIVESRLKVMMEEDYLALQNNALEQQPGERAAAEERSSTMQRVSAQMIKDVLIPVIEEEVNNGEHFAPLRQIYNSLILATWYKQNLRESYLAKVYVGENKVSGIDISEKTAKERIYRKYLEAFEKGVYNYVREEFDPELQEVIPRKYFSGGMRFGADIFSDVLTVEETHPDLALITARQQTDGQLRTLPTNVRPYRAEDTAPRKDAAILSDTTAVDLGDFITYRKLFLSDAATGQDALATVGNPGAFQTVINAGREGREPAKIDFLITRQAPIQQSILELVANASDAISGRSTSIGRFGVGALQMLAFVLDEKNPALSAGAHILVNTRTDADGARQIQFFKGEDGRVKFNVLSGTRSVNGTEVRIIFPGGIEQPTKDLITTFIEERLNLFTKMPVNLNGRLINPLDDHIFLNGDKVRYDFPEAAIKVEIRNNEIVVEDFGTGMSDQVLLDKYLIPRRGENQAFLKAQTEEEIRREVHIFYKGPQRADQKTSSRIVFQVGGINIQSQDIEGYGLPRELIIQLPSTTKLTVSRDKIEIDESTHAAIRAVARKIAEGNPIHQIALMNGFMQAVKLLDAVNTRVEALQPLVDTAKEVFIPFVMRHQGLILPNDELFRQMEAPADTLFLDDTLTYKISPNQIPGAEDLDRAFRPGRFSKAYVVPFKSGADVTFLEAGPYLLINKAVYERYKNQPMLLNLRLNFYRGYGRRPKPRGTIIAPQDIPEAPKQTDVLPILEEFDALKSVMSAEQSDWLQQYFRQRAQPTLKELDIQIKMAEIRSVIFERPDIDVERIMRKMDQMGGLGEFSDGKDKAILSDSERELYIRRAGNIKFMTVNKDVDASEERVKKVFARLDAYIAGVPEFLRERVDWKWILPMIGSSGAKFETLLENPNQILLPDTEFLELNAPFFLNQERSERLERYLVNLQSTGGLVDGQGGRILHQILAVLDHKGIEGIDTEVLEMAGRIFANRNMESMEEAFDAINEALPFVEGPGINRVLTRWLRIYDQDPKAALAFAERLQKSYSSEQADEALPLTYQFLQRSGRDIIQQSKHSALTPDGQRKIIAHRQFLFVYDVESGAELGHFTDIHAGTTGVTSNIEISGSGLGAATGDEAGNVAIWNIATGKVIRRISAHEGPVSKVRLTPDGEILISNGQDGSLKAWSTQTGQQLYQLLQPGRGQVEMELTEDGERLAVLKSDGSMDVYSAGSGEMINSVPAPAKQLFGITAQLLATPDSTRLINIGENITVFPLSTSGNIVRRVGWPSSFKVATVTPDSKKLIVQMIDQENNRFDIGVLDLETLNVLQIFEGHEGAITNLTVAPNGIDLFSHGSDGKIKVWQIRSDIAEEDLHFVTSEGTPIQNLSLIAREKPVQTLEGDRFSVTRMDFSPDGQWFMTTNEGPGLPGAIRVGRGSAQVRPALSLDGVRTGEVQTSFGSPDGIHLITVDTDGRIRVRDIASGTVTNELGLSEMRPEDIQKIIFVKDTIVVVSKHNTMEVFDRETSRLLRTVGDDMLGLGPKGRYYLAAGLNVALRDTDTDRVRLQFQLGQVPKFTRNASGDALLFVPDTASKDTTIFNLEKNEGSYVIPSLVAINDAILISSNNRFMMVPSMMILNKWDVWDLEKKTLVISIDGVRRARIIPGLDVAVVERTGAPYVQLVDLKSGTANRSPDRTEGQTETRLDRLEDWQISENGRFLVLPLDDGRIQVWNLLSNEVSYELSNQYAEVKISPDQKYLVAMNNDFETMSVIDIITGDLINEWVPFDTATGSFSFSADGKVLITMDESSNIRAWRWDQLTNPVTERTGFAALNPRDNLKGIPSLLRTIVRFLREEEVALLEQEEAAPRPESWQVTDRLEDPVSLALMNNLYDTFSREIQENPDITFSELLTMMNRLRGSNLADYVNIIRSAIEGQDKTQRAWVREIAIQNGRDATRRAREEGTLNADQGDLEIRNFMQGDDWIFSVRDHGTGMNLFQLIRYFFPLDQSSKDFLNDTGNLGQGNYTLFADFDRVFIRTSTGDGMIHELEIVPDATLGPVIEKWEVLSGNEKGTEIRRIKNNTKSDPQLESLFVQEALQRFAGGITSPQQRRRRGEAADIRDVRIPYNGETFDEEIAVTASSTLGRQGGLLAVGRAEDKLSQRVIQDGIFVKEPDQKELRFVPKWLQAAFERLGGMHIALPRNIQLNIPRTGYSQEHKFLKQLQVGVLHNILKTVLRDYVDEGLKIPGTPADYFDNYLTTEQTQAQEIVRLLHAGRYDEIDEQSLASFIENPTRLFSLMAYLPFESQAYDGEMTLHEIRERFIEQSRLRPRADGAVSIGTQTRLKDTFVPRGEFAADIEESVGNLAEAAKGIVNGRLKSWAQAQRAKTRDPQEAWDRLPENSKILMDYLIRRFIQPVVGEEMPDIGYYNREDNASAKAGSIGMLWNLAYNEPRFARLIELSQNVGALQAELQNGPEGSVLGGFIQTLMHETQHLPQFEEPGDHTHHDDDEIEGLDQRDDTRFGTRMGRAIDKFLIGLTDDLVTELTRSPAEMQAFISQVDQAARTRKNTPKDAAVLGVSQQEVGGIDLNPNRLDLEVGGDGSRVVIPFDPATLDALPVEGFYPVILNVLPTNLPLLLGANSTETEDQPDPQLISALREEDVML